MALTYELATLFLTANEKNCDDVDDGNSSNNNDDACYRS